jgi:2-polyprenyl-6-hydroxyphenyl methylase/3-demethylubiquinone-9 3-methyltransferase
MLNQFSEPDSSRFEFGKNWQSYSKNIDQEKIDEAVVSLKSFLKVDNLNAKTFLDIGCGSGLFSLAARNLGATVYSFDYDNDSVSCTKTLKSIYCKDDEAWRIETGSILDDVFVNQLGKFDYVYSWGVLHHTGDMQKALLNAANCVNDDGAIYIAIYNDQGFQSRIWKKLKKFYCEHNGKKLSILMIFVPLFFCITLIKGIIVKFNPFYFFFEYKKNRGMSIYYDWIDWLGGYPFEVATPEKIIFIYKDLGFELSNLRTKNGSGCNEFLFVRA